MRTIDDSGGPRHGPSAAPSDAARSGGLPRWLPLALLLLGAFAARVWHLDAESLWGDEIRTARLANLPSGELLRRIFVERQFAVPVLHLLLSRVALSIDPGDWSLRMVSVLAGVGGVAAVLGLGREVAGARAGWIAATLLAVSPGHIAFSREARPYSLLVLLVALLLWSLVRAQRSGTPRAWLGVGCLAVVTCLTSFLGVLPAAATVLSGALALSWRRRWGALLMLFLPAALLSPAWWTILQLRKELVLDGRISTRLFEPATLATWSPLLGPGGGSRFALAVVLGVLGLAVSLRTRRSWALVAAACFALPLAFLALLPFNHAFSPRYVLFLLAPFVVLQAQGLLVLADAARARWGRDPALGLTLALVGLNLTAWGAAFEPWRRDWRGTAAAILERWPDEVLVLSSTVSPALPTADPTVERLGYYLGDRDGYSMPEGRAILPAGRLAPRWLELHLASLRTPVCGVILHDPLKPVELPAESCALRFHGLLLLVDDHPDWGATEQAAWILLAQAWAALNPEEQRWLLGRSIQTARSSDDPTARQAFAQRLEDFLERYAERFRPAEHALLACVVDELRDTPGGGFPMLLEELFYRRAHAASAPQPGKPARDAGPEDTQGL